MVDVQNSLTDALARASHSAAVDRLPSVEQTVRRFVEDGRVPGVVIAWKQGDGPLHYHGVGELGFQSGRPVDERSIFRIFSQTKPITGIATMMLIEDGALSLDQPLSDILPAFAEMQVIVDGDVTVTRPAARPITVQTANPIINVILTLLLRR